MNKEHVNLTATQRLMELLASMNHQIAYKIVECVKYRWKSPISFLDFGDTNDTISFVNSPKVWELMDKFGEDYKIQAWVSNRSSIKIGKAIKMIYGDSFPINQPKGTITPKPPIDIESFVNMFKAERDKNKNYERFELVKGRDIKYWYNQKNYSRFITEDTTLAKSCLRYEEAGKFLDMYVHNPELVNMLILKDDADRLRARAIVWHLSYPENRIYMDRVYTINDYDVELYKNYAREQGWLYKTRQTYGYHHNIIDGRTGEELYWENFPMRVIIKNKPVKYHPYLDTLCVYNPDTKMLSNEGKLLRRPPYLKLADAQGGYIDEADHREMVISRHYNDEIAREEAEFVDLDQDWVFQQDVVYVHNSGGKKSHRSSKLVGQSNIFGKIKYFLKETCVWSEHLKTFIYKESSREAFLDKDKTKKVIIHRRMIGKHFEMDKNGDIFKKKSDSIGFDDFEDYLRSKGLTMKSRRSVIEKLYKEWEYNRTIRWDEPIDETDTEEVTPGRSSRFREDSPWFNPYSYDTNSYYTEQPQVRRGVPRVEDELVVRDEPTPMPELSQETIDAISRLTRTPHTEMDTPAPNQNQLIGIGRGRVVRPDPPIERDGPQNNGLINIGRVGGQPLRFTVGRPRIEERPEPTQNEPQSENGAALRGGIVNDNRERDTMGHVDTSAMGDTPNDTSDQNQQIHIHQGNETDFSDYLRQWTSARQVYTWNSVPITSNAGTAVNWGDWEVRRIVEPPQSENPNEEGGDNGGNQ